MNYPHQYMNRQSKQAHLKVNLKFKWTLILTQIPYKLFFISNKFIESIISWPKEVLNRKLISQTRVNMKYHCPELESNFNLIWAGSQSNNPWLDLGTLSKPEIRGVHDLNK